MTTRGLLSTAGQLPHAGVRQLLWTRMVWNIVVRWGQWGGGGKLVPHDLRRAASMRALDQGLSYRQLQMMSGHKDPKMMLRYDHQCEILDQHPVYHLNYE